MIFLDNVRVCFSVLENLFAETVLHKFYKCLARYGSDCRTRGRERDDEFSALVHDAERPNATIKRFVLAFQDAAFLKGLSSPFKMQPFCGSRNVQGTSSSGSSVR